VIGPDDGDVPLLLVDDSDDLRDMLACVVETLGFRALTAGDAASALDLARTHAPRFALVDVGLPDLDGYELAARLRAVSGLERMWIVALSGWDRDFVARPGSDVDVHLLKPIDRAALADALAPGMARLREPG
jgi:CheY-like chemotaxis protein